MSRIWILLIWWCLMIACKPHFTNPSGMTQNLYTFPEESEPHEGTWLQWPHQFQYGIQFREDLDDTWVAITRELVSSEKVHIIAYDEVEKNRIIGLLEEHRIDLNNIDFKVYPTDDFWVRDNGPIFVRDTNGELVIQDWGFNGWGGKTKFEKCDQIPARIAKDQGRIHIDLNQVMINEGGSVEIDGNGTLMACKSSILNQNRNPGMTQSEAEKIFSKYLGVTNFIWLDGQKGLDITDQHIDGFARFGNANTIVSMKPNDLLAFDVKPADIEKLYAAKNIRGEPYQFLQLPLTQNNVVTTYGKDLGYQGSYCNYYIANTKVLVPTYQDPNDEVALLILQRLYPDRQIVGIDCRNVYANGGMIHCITQQQPLD